MVELYINNQACTIKDLKIELNITNPFLSDKNSHTLDITLPLTNENNARIFKFLNRFDKPIKNSESYYGVIRNDGVVIFEGDVSILEVDDESIKIQIVKKENFFRFKDEDDTRLIGGYRIDRLPLSDFTELQGVDTLDAYKDYYLEPTYHESWDFPSVFYYHPLLIKIFETILEKLGFKVVSNFLRQHLFYDQLIIITKFTGGNVSRDLPAWTVAKFVIEFEKLFNCEVLFNVDDNTAIIRSKKIYLESTIYLETLDDYKVETQEAGKGLNLYDNAAYNFPDELYYKEADLTEEQNEKIKLFEVEQWVIPENSPIRGPEKFRYKNTLGTKFYGEFCRYDQNEEGFKNGTLRPVNNYRHLGNLDADNLIKLNIIPCKHTCVYHRRVISGGSIQVSPYKIYPVSVEYDRPEPTIQNDSYSIIKEGVIPMPNSNDSQMLIAVIPKKNMTWHSSIFLPFAINNAFNDESFLWSEDVSTDINLSLSYLKKEFWTNVPVDDTNKIDVKAFMDFNENIENLKINIKNKLFVIESVKFTIDQSGLNPIAELELYPLKEQS